MTRQTRRVGRRLRPVIRMNARAPHGNWLAIHDRASYFHKDTPNLFLVAEPVYQGDSGIAVYRLN